MVAKFKSSVMVMVMVAKFELEKNLDASSLQVREAEGRRAEEQLAQTAPEVPTILVYPVSTFPSGATPTSTTCRAASPS